MTSTIRELEDRLRAARRYVERAQAALNDAQTGNEWADYKRALRAQLTAERDLALARGEPTCLPLDWEPLWSSAAPAPLVVAAAETTFLVYTVDEHDKAWEGITDAIAIVEFKRCYGHRFGGPNDEAWHAHPLYSKGLEPYRGHHVVNSPWIAAEREMSPGDSRWEALRHYMLLFKDEIFECLAEGHACEVHQTTYRGALERIAARVASSER